MSLRKVFIRIGLIVGFLLASHTVIAGPVRCSVNNQDSTCVGQITTAWQSPPTCPTTPGYTTVAAAQWIGSGYTSPQCIYHAPPSCPSGYTQTTSPNWDGTTWVGLNCTPNLPQVATIVSTTGFWVWADCGSWNQAQKQGPIPIAVYENTWSDGSITYFQYYFGKQYPVSVDSKGRYYVTAIGDNWDTYPEGLPWPQASLYEVSGGYPGASIPPQPAYSCSGGTH